MEKRQNMTYTILRCETTLPCAGSRLAIPEVFNCTNYFYCDFKELHSLLCFIFIYVFTWLIHQLGFKIMCSSEMCLSVYIMKSVKSMWYILHGLCCVLCVLVICRRKWMYNRWWVFMYINWEFLQWLFDTVFVWVYRLELWVHGATNQTSP